MLIKGNLAFSGVVLGGPLFLLVISPLNAIAQEQQFKIYNDPEQRFTIEYPSDWYVNEESSKSADPIVVRFDSSEPRIVAGTDLTIPNVWITIRDPLPGETSLETMSSKLVSSMSAAGEVVESNYTTLSDLRAYAAANIFYGEMHSKSVWTIHNDKVYSISYNAHSYDYEIFLPVFQQMVDSFHITNI